MTEPDDTVFAKSLAEAGGQPQTTYAGIEALTDRLVGVKLFTLMTGDTQAKMSERVYSNVPDAYPVSGTRPCNRTHWSEITLTRQETFAVNTIDEIAAVVGTISCLHKAGSHTPERVATAEALKLPGAACMLRHAVMRMEARR